MKKIFVFGLVVSAACMVACGDDTSANSSLDKTSEGEVIGDDSGNTDSSPSSAESEEGSSSESNASKPNGDSSSSAKSGNSSSSDDGSADKIWSWDTPKENFLNPNIKYRTITDKRDHKTYKVIDYSTSYKVRDGVAHYFSGSWFAENLDYEMDGSWCFDNDSEKCKSAGRLYTWDAAMKACPEGWQLPNDLDWEELFGIWEGQSKDVTGKRLKSKTGWTWEDTQGDFIDYNGYDELGFSAIPAGLWSSEFEWYARAGEAAAFWSSTEASDNKVNRVFLDKSEAATISAASKDDGFSVRCVQKDEE